ncbi:MAG: hypothetical protein EA422_14495 [Gemmatimonadales bacterium]|nr:MAG: hypothetical protein EA422_14495 [Gemmatimonadales bacterium]
MDPDTWRGYSGSGKRPPARGASPVPLHVEADLLFQSEGGNARLTASGRTLRLDVTGTDPASLVPEGLRPLSFLRQVRSSLAHGGLELRVEAAGRPLLRLDPSLSPGFWGRLIRVPGIRVGFLGGLQLWWRVLRGG